MNDLTGKRFGFLVVLERAGTNKHRSATWLCRCDCGTEKIVTSADLMTRENPSCGYCKERKCVKCGVKFKKTNNRQIFCQNCKPK